MTPGLDYVYRVRKRKKLCVVFRYFATRRPWQLVRPGLSSLNHPTSMIRWHMTLTLQVFALKAISHKCAFIVLPININNSNKILYYLTLQVFFLCNGVRILNSPWLQCLVILRDNITVCVKCVCH
jgi:hypothetical protein